MVDVDSSTLMSLIQTELDNFVLSSSFIVPAISSEEN